MAKVQRKNFSFKFPVKQKIVRDLRIVIDHVGDLVISGTAYFNPQASLLEMDERFGVDIDFATWNGMDVKNLLDAMGCFDEVNDAALRAASELFTTSNVAA